MSAPLAKQIRRPENMDLICTRIAEGFTLRQIAREIGCDNSAIVHWYAEDAIFAQRYARAKEAQAEHFAEEIVEISDDGTNDWQQRELEDGTVVEVPDQEHIQRSRLRVDARKWLMAKMAPKRYGERMQVEHRQTTDAAEVPYDELMAMAQAAPLTIEHQPEESMTPPKCRSCGVAEWNHTCAGPSRRMTKAVHAEPKSEPVDIGPVHAVASVDNGAVHDPMAARRAYKAEHERRRRAKLKGNRGPSS